MSGARSSRRADRRARPRRRRRRPCAPRTRRTPPRRRSRTGSSPAPPPRAGRGRPRPRSRRPAVDADPLGPAADVGRDRRADRETFGAEQRLDRQRRGRLAVRADDVDRRIGELWVTERGEERPHPPQPEPLRPRRLGVEPGGWLAGEGIELTPVAGELLALGLDHLGLRVRDELVVREHALAPLDLLRSRSISAAAFPLPSSARAGRRRRRSAARRLRADRDPAAPEDRGRLLDGVERVRSLRTRRSARARARRSDVVVELRPDLLGHVRHDRMQELEQPLERRQRGRRTSGSPRRGLRPRRTSRRSRRR